MALDDFAGEVETDAQTGIRLFLRIGHLIEPLKDACLVLCRNADTEILHADCSAIPVLEETNNDPVSAGRIFHGVGDKIRENLADAVSISVDLRVLALFKDQPVRGCTLIETASDRKS